MASFVARAGIVALGAALLLLGVTDAALGHVQMPLSHGDFNGDGLADVVVGSTVVFGKSDSAPVDLRHLGVLGVTPRRGYSGELVGDVNGDSIDDFVASRGGRLAVVAFGRSGPGSTEPSAMPLVGLRIGGLPRHAYVSLVAGAGDVNGDGRADVAVTTARSSGLPLDAYLVLGRRQPGSVSVRQRHGVVRLAKFGQHDLHAAGDLDGDGRDDLVSGDWGGGGYCGEVGNEFAETLLVRPWRTAHGWRRSRTRYGGPDFCLLGFWTGALGDINGDGRDDVGIDASDERRDRNELFAVFGSSRRGRVTLTRAKPPRLTVIDTTRGDPAQTEGQIAAAGDVNGDQLADLLYQSADGRISLIYGSSSARRVLVGAMLPTEGTDAVVVPHGFEVAAPQGLGDVNGDGTPDFALCEERGNYPHALIVLFASRVGPAPRLDALSDRGFIVRGANDGPC